MMRSLNTCRHLSLTISTVLMLACNGAGTNEPQPKESEWQGKPPQAPVTYETVASPYTALQALWAPKVPPADTLDRMDSGALTVTDISEFADAGLGVELVNGETWTTYNALIDTAAYNAHITSGNASTRSVLYFWQSADPQLIDEESPIRFAGVYALTFGSTFRPQSHLITQVFESHVRTARAISDLSGRPFEFAFVAGDISDTGQENEFEWLVTALNGGVIDPDSGVNDDPVPGPGNDFNDPYVSVGLGNVPWYAALGNHETLYIGTFEADEVVKEAAVGDEVFNGIEHTLGLKTSKGVANGYRDGSSPYASIVTQGRTPPDEKRKILSMQEAIAYLRNAPGEPEGHGLTDADVDAVKGYFSIKPLGDGKPVRFIVLNTIQQDPPSASGQLDSEQFSWLKTELDAAVAANEIVIVGSHHRPGSFSEVSPVSGEEFAAELAAHENVVLHITGHGHANSRRLQLVDGSRGYWDLMLASTVDFPMQSRIYELVYEGDGYLTIYCTNIDHNAPESSLAHEARSLAAGHRYFQDNEYRNYWDDNRGNRNLELRIKLPDAVATAVEAETWPTKVESTSTLMNLTAP